MNALKPISSSLRVQSAACAMLVRPVAFGYNAETAATNQFQRQADTAGGTHAAAAGEAVDAPPLMLRARAEFDALCAALEAAGLRTCIAEDSPEPVKPDAVFPNNWVSWHHDGTVVLYPMQSASRRPERRAELVSAVEQEVGFQRRRLIDLSVHERDGHYLEGTGSLVLDHPGGIAYACRSARTHERLVQEWTRLMGYEPLLFDARAPGGRAPYHTNVMLAIGTHWAIVCSEAIVPADRRRVLTRLAESGRAVVEISLAAMQHFAGNVLELRTGGAAGTSRMAGAMSCERALLVMSATAAAALQQDPGAWQKLRGCVDEVIAVHVEGIEQAGGGSVRCMLAEIFAV